MRFPFMKKKIDEEKPQTTKQKVRSLVDEIRKREEEMAERIHRMNAKAKLRGVLP